MAAQMAANPISEMATNPTSQMAALGLGVHSKQNLNS